MTRIYCVAQGTIFNVLSVQFSCSVMSHSVTPWTAACQVPLSFTISQSLLKSTPTESDAI